MFKVFLKRLAQSKKNMYLLSFLIVGLNIATSIILKTLADQSPSLSYLFLSFGFVAILNVFRMILWYFANKEFPLSQFYPLTSMIFPAMALVAWFYGDEIGYFQMGGLILITIGVILIKKQPAESFASPVEGELS